MKTFVLDMVLCGMIYVVLIYFIFRLRRNKSQGDGNDGGIFDLTPPEIDLPPGITWPIEGIDVSEKETEEVL